MSQKKSRRRRASAAADLNNPTSIYRDLVELVLRAPKPDKRPTGEQSRDDQRRGIAPAMAWGWLMRVLRTGEAAIRLEAAGYGSEAPPLIRSALEHAIRLQWASEYGDKFVEVALIAQQKSFATMDAAQADGWRFDEDFSDALKKRAAEASDDYKSLSTLTALRHIVKENPDRLGSLYMAWLFDTQESHPSVLTSQPYYVVDDSGTNYTLLSEPRLPSQAP